MNVKQNLVKKKLKKITEFEEKNSTPHRALNFLFLLNF